MLLTSDLEFSKATHFGPLRLRSIRQYKQTISMLRIPYVEHPLTP